MGEIHYSVIITKQYKVYQKEKKFTALNVLFTSRSMKIRKTEKKDHKNNIKDIEFVLFVKIKVTYLRKLRVKSKKLKNELYNLGKL